MAWPINIELRHLRYFVTASELGSFRRAGAALGVKGSTISRQIRELEDRIGAPLFHRDYRGVVLTGAGSLFLDRAKTVLFGVVQAANDLGEICCLERGRIRISTFTSLTSGFLPKLLRSYTRKQEEIRFVRADFSECLESLRQSALDIAFVAGTRNWPALETEYLWSEQLFIAVSTLHPVCSLKEVRWKDICDETFVTHSIPADGGVHEHVIRMRESIGHIARVRTQDVGRDNLLALVSMQCGMVLTSRSATAAPHPGVVYIPVAGESVPFSAVWSRHNNKPSLRKFIDLAKQLSRSIESHHRVQETPDDEVA